MSVAEPDAVAPVVVPDWPAEIHRPPRPKAILEAFSELVIVSAWGGRLWATNRYVLAQARWVADLLDWWNLPVAAGTYPVEGSKVFPSIDSTAAPNLDPLLTMTPGATPVTPRVVHGYPVRLQGAVGPLVPFSPNSVDDRGVLVDQRWLDLACPGWDLPAYSPWRFEVVLPDTGVATKDPLRIYRVDTNDLWGIVMGVRGTR